VTHAGAAKAGIAAFTIISATELRQYGITVNAIAPRAQTRMTEGLRERTGEEIKRRNPRWVAPIVVWLASEESGDVTGRVFEAELGPKVAELMKQARPNADIWGRDIVS
jgi:NAD(P)-dependent dehydrogenase (short-subunit alcohol dehydrogenase family)